MLGILVAPPTAGADPDLSDASWSTVEPMDSGVDDVFTHTLQQAQQMYGKSVVVEGIRRPRFRGRSIRWVDSPVTSTRRALVKTFFANPAVDFTTNQTGPRMVPLAESSIYVVIPVNDENEASRRDHTQAMTNGKIYLKTGARHPYYNREVIDIDLGSIGQTQMTSPRYDVDQKGIATPLAPNEGDIIPVEPAYPAEIDESAGPNLVVLTQAVWHYQQGRWQKEKRGVKVIENGFVQDHLHLQLLEGNWVDEAGNATASAGQAVTVLAWLKK